MTESRLPKKDLEILNKKANGYNPMIITSNTIDATKKQKKSWLHTADSKSKYNDTLPLTEERLRTVKKHDVVDLGHRDEEILETIESKLSEGNNKRADEEPEEIFEIQLDEVRADEIKEVLTEGAFEEIGAWNENTWQGDDIKIYRDVNDRNKQRAKMNEKFYKDHPELTDGGKGVVSASTHKKAQSNKRAEVELEVIKNDIDLFISELFTGILNKKLDKISVHYVIDRLREING